MLLYGFAGGLRRSEVVGLDAGWEPTGLAGMHGDLGEAGRMEKFTWHSLHAGSASSVEVDDRVNLTKAAGL